MIHLDVYFSSSKSQMEGEIQSFFTFWVISAYNI